MDSFQVFCGVKIMLLRRTAVETDFVVMAACSARGVLWK